MFEEADGARIVIDRIVQEGLQRGLRSDETRRTLSYVASLSNARTKLEASFTILLRILRLG